MPSISGMLRRIRLREILATLLLLTFSLAATTLLLGVLRSVVLAPLPFEDPDGLVTLWGLDRETGTKRRVASLEFLRWKERVAEVDEMALVTYSRWVMDGLENPLHVDGARITPDFFDVLGVRPVRGRLFAPSDVGGAAVAVVSYSFWQSHLAAVEPVVGHVLQLDGEDVEIVGVLAPQVMPLVGWHSGHFEIGDRPFLWRVQKDPRELQPGSGVHGIVARLAPGVEAFTLDEKLERWAGLLRTEFPERYGEEDGLIAVPFAVEAYGSTRPLLLLLSGSVLLLLVVVGADLSILALLRFEAERTGRAVRLALGASPRRLRWGRLGRGAALGALGGLMGGLGARFILGAVVHWVPVDVPRLATVDLGEEVVLSSILLGAVLMAIAGLLPDFVQRESSLANVLRRRGVFGSVRRRCLQKTLIAAQAGLAVFLLVGASLLGRSLEALKRIDPGFDAGSVLTVRLEPRGSEVWEREPLVAAWEGLIQTVGSQPGVLSVAAAYDPPSHANWTQGFRVSTARGPEVRSAAFRTVTPEAFATLGIPLLEGRLLDRRDDAAAAGAVLVNEAFVRQHFPDRPPLGQTLEIPTTQFRWGEGAIPSTFTVVGVVGDVRFRGLTTPVEPAFYLPYRQTPHSAMTLLIRTEASPVALLGPLREIVQRRMPGTPFGDVETLEEALASQTAGARFGSWTMGLFAGASLLLAALGIWTVLDASLRERRSEVGLRMALGARRREIGLWGLRHGLVPVAVGSVAGLTAAAAASRWLERILVEVEPSDPRSWILAVALLGLVALGSCAGPVRRAVALDPAVTLRGD